MRSRRLTLPISFGAVAAATLAFGQEPPPAPPQNPPVNPPVAPPLDQKPTLEPTGFPGLPEKDSRLPPPDESTSQEFRIISSEQTTRDGSIVKLRGKAHFQYKGYDVFAREVDGDLTTNIFTLRGGAEVIGKDSIVLGETVVVDLDDRTFRALKTAAELRPGFLQGRTLDNVYLNGEEAWGSEKEIFAHNCGLTTCIYDHPHYLLDAKSIDLRPYKRIILRNVRLEVLNRTLFTIPYLSIPLDNRRERYSPEVGHTPEEGYYIKTKWGIPVKGLNTLDANVDYFEKLGPGLGGIFRYAANRSEGYLRVYSIVDRDTVEIQQGHKQLLGNNLFTIENNYQQRNTFNAPQNTLFSTRANILFPQGRNSTRISWFRTSNESASFSSTSQTVAVSDSRTLWEKFRSQFDVSWVKSESSFSGGGSERQQVDIRFRGSQDLKKAQAEIEYQRTIPIGDTSNFFSSSDRTPVLTLRSDAKRLWNKPNEWLNAEMSIGEFVDPVEKDQISRTNLDLKSFYASPVRQDEKFSFNLSGRFKQSFYSDDTAQFAVAYGGQAKYSLGSDTEMSVRYNYLEPEGFTPLSIDRIGRTNLATADLSWRPAPKFLIGLQTGYDFLLFERHEPTAWQPVGLRMEWNPKTWFQVRAYPVYDPLNQIWSSVRFDMVYLPGATSVSLGARYDGFRRVWGATNLYVDALKFGRTKASFFLSYNGYIKKFEERHLSLTYDLHCAEAILQIRESNVGFRTGREVAFFIRLKAFPFDTDFGLTRRGAPLGTGTGR